VFISSTFRDMQTERDILIKKVFPHLRKVCAERGVTLTEVDLRWGINEEQAESGAIIPICLSEIDRCHPFFIGMIGNTYGTIIRDLGTAFLPEDLPEALAECSMTELEITHGVLNRKQTYAYLYIRDPEFQQSQNQQPISEWGQKRLDRFKQSLRQAHDRGLCQLRDGYRDPEVFGRAVRRDLTRLVDRLFPEETVPSALEREGIEHASYGAARRFAFVGRAELLKSLTTLTEDSHSPIVLVGEPGCGKSALLAEWVHRRRQTHPDDLVIEHYIGSTPESADWRSVVRRVLEELKRAFDLAEEVPKEDGELRFALHEWLHKFAYKRRVVLVLDALNQLSDSEAAGQLGWLPRTFPKGFLLLASTLAGPDREAVKSKGWTEIDVPLFDASDIVPATTAYFQVYGKTPSSLLLSKLTSTPAALNPLFLRSVLDELRQFGKHELLQQRADEYLGSPDLSSLLDRIVSRWESDFGNDPLCPGLVQRTLCLIACARFGLTEEELLALLGGDHDRLPQRVFAPFNLASEQAMIRRSGLITFGHEFLRHTVSRRWLSSGEALTATRQALVRYFENRPFDDARKLDELPQLYVHLQQWSRLKTLLTNRTAFSEMIFAPRWVWELHAYWIALQSHFSAGPSYLEALPNWEAQEGKDGKAADFPSALMGVGSFLMQRGEHEAAISTFSEVVARLGSSRSDVATDLCAALSSRSAAFGAVGGFDDAERDAGRALALAEHEGEERLPPYLNGHALILKNLGRFDEAEKLYRRAWTLLAKLKPDDKAALIPVLSNLAQLLHTTQRLQEAEPLMRQAAELTKITVGENHPDYGTQCHNLGSLLSDLKQYAASEPLFCRSLDIAKRTLREDHPKLAIIHARYGLMLSLTQRHQEAIANLERALEIRIKAWGASHPAAAKDMKAVAFAYLGAGNIPVAVSLGRRALGIYARAYAADDPRLERQRRELAFLLEIAATRGLTSGPSRLP
jgi:tetratricopeptide (TPR) repeat protein